MCASKMGFVMNDYSPTENMDQAYFRAVAEMMSGVYCHAFGEYGAVVYMLDTRTHIILTNHGGEINVSGVNHKIDVPSVPTEPSFNGTDRNVGPVTAAYRIHNMLNDLKIDYSENYDD